ncbi:MAG: tyrosine--tRNA ligase [Candidatus Woykebacteria bacterium RIFCSPHIGHO2_12_FULL_43_10]|uniref:Tyrosine--tRNA ligase n=2 Tax=Candidatus Woykeibacteriota TaxID=1817899 RepID=A0A1G1WWP6_9BACT|nr:MAG: tyrosine--tRNA ligase [Candidatus Woykebacteria bacterium RIFCSPHIGHO2_02_FULL_43_16b]OGY28645.1 MAG: tyrosine--tRNA ligase [Candidatus Woykebacteria bacterium RIFCSPHIGHO2_01_FULL_43_29]OGY29045.1 MAG: tyrosine--tRNA ligase [Candidatus Woykebacteria bacterium RIFCSPHIGHO2_12_FULL_43_10]OGY32186.1 MAG: tyrosine--tRNA ligase [Candidatus Woykebacteria bacterium RIFCSPLOWO2_01_FULL_43_14]
MSDLETALKRGVEKIYPSEEELRKVLDTDKKITLYCGYDPTAPDLHLGHAITLLKLADFQKLGHKVIFLIGDFTGMIGDPTDKSATRVKLTREQVEENAKTFKDQGGKILNFGGTNSAEVKFNSEWNDKVTFRDLIEIASHFTVQQMIERDMFDKRIKENKPISLHEFLYPLMQGYDSVAMNVDLEIGGSDQTFNMLAGRTLMKQLKGKEKFVLTLQLLEDDQGRKMSKSEGSFISLRDNPNDMYAKVMAFPDGMITKAFILCTRVEEARVEQYDQQLKSGENPINVKKILAYEVIKLLNNEHVAKEAQENFESVVQRKELPSNIPVITLSTPKSVATITNILVSANFAGSNSEARRLISQGSVSDDGEKITDFNFIPESGSIIKSGKKHIAKIVYKGEQ